MSILQRCLTHTLSILVAAQLLVAPHSEALAQDMAASAAQSAAQAAQAQAQAAALQAAQNNVNTQATGQGTAQEGTPNTLSTGAAAAQTSSGSCSEGLVWNAMVGRCLTSEAVAKMQAASAQCEAQSSADAKKACYLAAAEGELATAEADGKVKKAGTVNKSWMSIILAMGGLLASANFLMTGGSSCPGATSAWLIAGSSAAAIAGEIMSGMTYQKKIKEAQEALKKIADSSSGQTATGGSSDNANATNVQQEVFDALIKREDAVIAAAKTKKMLYTVAMAGYAAAAVMAAIEVVRMMSPEGCSSCVCYNNAQASCGANKSPAMAYLDNYFEKRQRLTFQEFTTDPRMGQTTSMEELIALVEDRNAIRTGSLQSITIDHYAPIQNAFADSRNQFSSDDFFLVKGLVVLAQNLSIAPAQAADDPPAGSSGGGGGPLQFIRSMGSRLANGAKSLSKGLGQLFANPITRLALSGVMGVNSMFMVKHISEEQKKAEDRKSFLEKLRQQVIAAGQAFGCANADRVNPANPQCYCYNEDGSFNPARNNSSACQAYRNQVTPPNMQGDQYNPNGTLIGASDQATCVAKNGTYDGNCSCRLNNTCLSISSQINGTQPGMELLGTLPSTISGLTSGTLASSNINASAMRGTAAALTRTLDNLANKYPSVKKARAQADKAAKQATDQATRLIASNPSLATPPADFGASSGLLGATSPQDALNKVKEELARQEVGHVSSAAAPAGTSAAKGQGDALDFSGLGGAAGMGGVTVQNDEKLAQVMNSSIEMGNSDINTDSQTNIFQILSNRYQRSGMRRLFSGEQVVPADRPSDNQINK